MVKDNTRFRKIRIIMKSNTLHHVYGVVIPSNIAQSWLNIQVTVSESGSQIILTSGCKPTKLSKKELHQHTKIVDKIRL